MLQYTKIQTVEYTIEQGKNFQMVYKIIFESDCSKDIVSLAQLHFRLLLLCDIYIYIYIFVIAWTKTNINLKWSIKAPKLRIWRLER